MALHRALPYQRGLTKGDLISPFLYVLVMNGLSKLLKYVVTENWIKRFNVTMDIKVTCQPHISHNPDDILIICDPEESQLGYLN